MTEIRIESKSTDGITFFDRRAPLPIYYYDTVRKGEQEYLILHNGNSMVPLSRDAVRHLMSELLRTLTDLTDDDLREIARLQLSEGSTDPRLYLTHSKDAQSPTHRSRPGFVYVVQWESVYKIGKSKSPRGRLSPMTAKFPYPLTLQLLVQTENMVETEAALHTFFAAKREGGEW